MAIAVSIRTPDSTVFEGAVDGMVVPGTHGEFAVLTDHAPMIGAVAPGILRTDKTGAGSAFFVVGAGVIEVLRNQVVVLTDSVVAARSAEDAEDRLEALLKDLSRPLVLKAGAS